MLDFGPTREVDPPPPPPPPPPSPPPSPPLTPSRTVAGFPPPSSGRSPSVKAQSFNIVAAPLAAHSPLLPVRSRTRWRSARSSTACRSGTTASPVGGGALRGRFARAAHRAGSATPSPLAFIFSLENAAAPAVPIFVCKNPHRTAFSQRENKRAWARSFCRPCCRKGWSIRGGVGGGVGRVC